MTSDLEFIKDILVKSCHKFHGRKVGNNITNQGIWLSIFGSSTSQSTESRNSSNLLSFPGPRKALEETPNNH
jgi:hypothetical protein